MRAAELPDRYRRALEQSGFRRLEVARDPACLAPFYSQISSRYPRLFEGLCLGYSWQNAVVGEVQFAPNPGGDDLAGLAKSIRYDEHLWNYLVSRGFLVFGRMSGGRYDPVAFDMAARRGHDAPVCRIDHEAILSFEHLGHPALLAPTFHAFLETHLGGAGEAA